MRSTFLTQLRRGRDFDYILWQEEGHWTAHIPSVPGVYGVGKTQGAAAKDLSDGLTDLFDYLG